MTLVNYREEVKQELLRILSYWKTYAIEKGRDGFYGVVDASNRQDANAPKSVVINSRILWTFSAAHQLFPDPDYPLVAKRAFNYIRKYFVDARNGGVYWSVNANGSPLQTKKQLYGHAFAIFGLSEYYKLSKDDSALQLAIRLFDLLVRYNYDPVNGGYMEAFTREWEDTDDYVLSRAPLVKSMNSHLHILEAFTSLHRNWNDSRSAMHLKHSLEIMLDRIIDPATNRMTLFFTKDWQRRSPIISYGHDIEASWLIREAAEALKDETLINRCKDISVEMAKGAADGLADDGSLYYELDTSNQKLNKNKQWWPQAEAMVGFFNAYQLTGKVHWLEKSERAWEYIKKHMLDYENGEWFGGLDENNKVTARDKVTFWKCPYHNGRACMELWRRLG